MWLDYTGHIVFLNKKYRKCVMKKVADLLLINKKCKIVIKLKEAGEIKLNEEKITIHAIKNFFQD